MEKQLLTSRIDFAVDSLVHERSDDEEEQSAAVDAAFAELADELASS